jgi:membrane-associated protein
VLTVLAELSLTALVVVFAGLMLVDAAPLFGLLVPGDLVVVSASTFAGWPAVLLTAAAGMVALVCGHVTGYLLGRHYGAHLWASRLGRRIGFERWCRAERTLRSGGDRTLVATPFIPVVNTVLPLLAGALGVRPARYLLLIALADAAWIAVWTAVGVVSAQLATTLGAADLALLVSGAVSVAVLVLTALTLRHSHRRGHPHRPQSGGPGVEPDSDIGSDLPVCVARPVQEAASTVTAGHRASPVNDPFTVVADEPAPGVRVVTVAGEVTIATSPVLDTELNAQVASGPDQLVVDLSAVRFLNYHAVVTLVTARRAASRAGIAFHLVGADVPAVNRPLRISGVLRHLDTHRHPSLADVLACTHPRTRRD